MFVQGDKVGPSIYIHVVLMIDTIISKEQDSEYGLHIELHVSTGYGNDFLLLNDPSLPISAYIMINRADVLIILWVSSQGLLQCLMSRF